MKAVGGALLCCWNVNNVCVCCRECEVKLPCPASRYTCTCSAAAAAVEPGGGGEESWREVEGPCFAKLKPAKNDLIV